MADEGEGGWFQNMAPYIAGLINTGANWISGNAGTSKQYHANKKLANLQHKHNMELMEYQLAYNTPKEQMKRFKLAGLNPNLVYGQGTPGNMDSPPRYPDIQAPDYQRMYENTFGDLGTKLQQAKLMQAQTDFTMTKTDESGVRQDQMKAQKALIEANPFLKKGYVDMMLLNLESAAKMKEQQAGFMLSKTQDDVTGARWERGYLQMQRELDLLTQRYNLNAADAKIKAEIIQSKGFQNDIDKVKANFMKNGDLSPEHIRQFIMMLIQRLM